MNRAALRLAGAGRLLACGGLSTLLFACGACGKDGTPAQSETGANSPYPCAELTTRAACEGVDLSDDESPNYSSNAKCFWAERWVAETDSCDAVESLDAVCMFQDGAAAGCPGGCEDPDEPDAPLEFVYARDLGDGTQEIVTGAPECWSLEGFAMCQGQSNPPSVNCACACGVAFP